ncbi:MAG: hypothetical protein R3200_14790 [Xanthomonadales bacterium]|nr:hypothetical protein [Xanthomonadales bacterium]
MSRVTAQTQSDGDALIQHVRELCDEERAAILDAGRRRARRIAMAARRRARQAVRRAVIAERRRIAAATAKIEAKVAARARRLAQRRDLELLEHLTPRVEEVLQDCWADQELRCTWVRNALAVAARVLPPGSWTVEFAGGLEEREIRDLEPCAIGDLELELKSAPELGAGLVIRSGKSVVDASTRGLVARKLHVQGLLLGYLGAPEDD